MNTVEQSDLKVVAEAQKLLKFEVEENSKDIKFLKNKSEE